MMYTLIIMHIHWVNLLLLFSGYRFVTNCDFLMVDCRQLALDGLK